MEALGRRLPKKQLTIHGCSSREGNESGLLDSVLGSPLAIPYQKLGAMDCEAEAQIGQFPGHRAAGRCVGDIIDKERPREVARAKSDLTD